MKLKKRIELMCFAFIAFILLGMTNVYAATCDAILTYEAAQFLAKILKYIQISAPILLIILCTFDFAGAVVAEDKDALKKAGSKAVKRAIVTVAIFFVPLLVKWILSIDAVNDSLNLVDDPTCGVTELDESNNSGVGE